MAQEIAFLNFNSNYASLSLQLIRDKNRNFHFYDCKMKNNSCNKKNQQLKLISNCKLSIGKVAGWWTELRRWSRYFSSQINLWQDFDWFQNLSLSGMKTLIFQLRFTSTSFSISQALERCACWRKVSRSTRWRHSQLTQISLSLVMGISSWQVNLSFASCARHTVKCVREVVNEKSLSWLILARARDWAMNNLYCKILRHE